MKALVKRSAEPGLWMCDVDAPDVGPDDALIRVLRTGVCGTDLHIHAWDDWAKRTIRTPLVIGHEFVGEIVQVGANVGGHEVGDVVSGEGHIVCGTCRNCMAGRRHLCARTLGLGVQRAGAFAEYVAVPQANLWRHAEDIDLDLAAIFDPFGNAVHTATAFPVLGEDVLITGAGPIGLMAAAVVRHAGARHVAITDVNPHRLALAEMIGVTRAVNAAEERLEDVQRELGMVEGFDVGLEMSGNPAAIGDMLSQMRHGGRIALLGIPTGDIAIDWNRVVFGGLTLRGIYGREMFETWYATTAMVQSGLDVGPVITHRYPASEHETAFATAAGGGAGKVILDWEAL